MSDPVLHHVLFYDYVEDVVERRGPYREGHIALLRQWKGDGKLVTAGALGTPPYGALFVFLVDDPAEIEAYVGADPYVANGIVTGHRIIPWNVVVS
jgi:uncharacterized protein YciI